jgi:nucleoside-diphosphate-sugar epimerase
MKVFLAGATGVLGTRLVPLLARSGHQITATTRSAARTEALRRLGARPMIVDPLNRQAVFAAVMSARPEVVVHQLTALAKVRSLKRFDDEFAMTNRLRTEGLDHLLEAATMVGAARFVAQSFTGWPSIREGSWVKTEEDPLDPQPLPAMRRSLDAIRHVERAVPDARGMEGIVLRYGHLYGPGTAIAKGGDIVEAVRGRRFPVVGSGAGIWSFVHVDDAAMATAIAIAGVPRGLYNIVDDEPADVATWLPELARVIGAKPPRQVPLWIGRLVIGDAGVLVMTESRGSSNQKAKRTLKWQLSYPSWRDGFRHGLSVSALAAV